MIKYILYSYPLIIIDILYLIRYNVSKYSLLVRIPLKKWDLQTAFNYFCETDVKDYTTYQGHVTR